MNRSRLFHAVRRRVAWLGLDVGVCQVTHGLGHGTEGRRGLYPAHGTGHGYGYKLALVFVLGKHHCKPQAIQCSEKEAVETVFDVLFGESCGAELRVGVSDGIKNPRERPAKLHGFRWGMCSGGRVHRWPTPVPGVIAEETRLALSFLLDGSRGEHDVLKVANQLVGKYHPELVFNEIGHLFSDEVGVLVCRVVASSLDAFVLLLEGPGLGVALGWDALVSPLS